MPAETVEFGADVPRKEYEAFKRAFPQYGATKWFINTVLREFNARIRDQPPMKENIRVAIDEMMEFSRLVREAKQEETQATES